MHTRIHAYKYIHIYYLYKYIHIFTQIPTSKYANLYILIYVINSILHYPMLYS